MILITRASQVNRYNNGDDTHRTEHAEKNKWNVNRPKLVVVNSKAVSWEVVHILVSKAHDTSRHNTARYLPDLG